MTDQLNCNKTIWHNIKNVTVWWQIIKIVTDTVTDLYKIVTFNVTDQLNCNKKFDIISKL